MASRATENNAGDLPPSKRPRIAAGRNSVSPTKTGGAEHVLSLLTGALPVMVENEWAGVKELGRIEQVCKTTKLEDDTWAVLCFLKWPTTKGILRNFFSRHGGYRGYCRKRMAKPLFGPAKERRQEIPPFTINPATTGFLLDVYVNDVPKLDIISPFGDKRVLDIFQQNGNVRFQVQCPIVLGRMECFAAKRCSCGGNCAGLNGTDFPELRYSLSLVRGSDIVSIGNPESTPCFSVNVSNISKNDNSGKYQKEDGSKCLFWAMPRFHDNEDDGMIKHEEQGLAFRRTREASEIKRRVRHHQIDLRAALQVDILPCSEKYGIIACEISIVAVQLSERRLVDGNDEGGGHNDVCKLFRLFHPDSNSPYDLEGVTPFHILEQIESTDWMHNG